MDRESSLNWGSDGNRKGSPHPYIQSFHTPITTAIVEHAYKTDNASGHTCEEYNRLSQELDTCNGADAVTTFPGASGAHKGLDSQLPYIPLSAQAFNQHNLQQANKPPAALRAQHATRPESESSPANTDCQTRGKRQSTAANMHNEAHSDAPHYQSSSRGQSRLADHAHATDSAGSGFCDDDPRSWDLECSSQSQELAAWGNALAGVGEHLGECKRGDYVGCCETVVE